MYSFWNFARFFRDTEETVLTEKSLIEQYMERVQKEHQRRRNLMARILKITVIALAVAILATGVIFGVMLATDGFSAGDDSEGEGGGTPSITGPEKGYVIVYIGDKPSYKSFVKTTGKGELKIEHNVNLDQEGTYTVRYTFGDLTYELTVFVRKRTFTDADRTKLYEDVEKIVINKGMKSGTKADQVKKVYAFVNSYIPWKDDPSNIEAKHGKAFSRDSWKEDWEEEAALTLASGKGDCYSYYSLSKAFFEVLGIENHGIQRSKDSSIEGTHFWNVVNVGENGDAWYFYDATVLGGNFPDGTKNGCLRTESDLKNYVTSANDGRRTDFYLFEKWEGFPTIATQKVN